MYKHRTSGQLAGTFMATGCVTCHSPEEYTSFSEWLAQKEVPVTTEVNEETGDVTFEAASADAVVNERDLANLIAQFHDLGSVVMSRDEHGKFVLWARSENVPLHDQFDRKLGKFVVMKRGWGTVEGA
jgi:hypothetical protein